MLRSRLAMLVVRTGSFMAQTPQMPHLSQLARAARRRRRDERGGVSDETAMIGLMLVVAVSVAGIILTLARGAARNLDFGF
jgi:2-C-methyl-D-erythritol 4-phosphate cytidylyltransferase